MKTFGWICIVIGGLSFIGAASAGHSVFGPLFWLALGIALVYLANQKEEEKKKNKTFITNNSQTPQTFESSPVQVAEPVKQKTYWENLKDNNPTKSKEIEELLNIDFSTLTDRDAQEKTETLERLSKSMNCPISQIRVNFLREIEKYPISLIPQIIETTNRGMDKEVETFHIKQENTATALMVKWLEERREESGAPDAIITAPVTDKEMEIAMSYFPYKDAEDIKERIKSLREMSELFKCPIEGLENFYKDDVMSKYDGAYENFHYIIETFKHMAYQAYEIAPRVALKPENTSYGILCDWLMDIMKAERRKFIDSGQAKCPYCNSNNVRLLMFDDEFECNSCKKRFGGI